MAVYTTGGGGGILGGLAGVMGLIPGMQIPAALLGAGNALANGDPMGAVKSAAGVVTRAAAPAVQAAAPMAPVVNPAAAAGMPGTGGQTGSLVNALTGVANGTYGQSAPGWNNPDISALTRNGPWARTWYNSADARRFY